ncbi:hypothetical protein KKH30_04285, partial [Candidatus Micrarchaeota archaeon]|nr:hypothetical protein [Candidatus Micrarchaeota archaeon]MBU1939957.1 hypothetical protein [Candidatus Micrarchaeota archaeon]
GKPWVALKGKVAEGRGKDYAEAKLEKVEKDKDGKETGKYYAEMMLCVEGTENLQLAVGNKAVLNATTKGLEKRQNDAKTREVELNVCGIHPLNAKQKAKELKIGETRYAMLAWEGGPESITLRELYNATEAAKLTEELRKKVLNRDSSAIVDPDAKRRQEAILTGYLPACAVSSAAMGLLTKGPWGIITDPTVYCGIPAAMAWAAQTGWGAEFKGIIYKYVDDIKEISPPQMRGALEGIESYLKGPSVFELGATDKEVNDLKVSVGATIAGNASYRLISQGGASLKSWKWKDFFGKGILGGLIKGAVPNAVGLYFYEKRFKQLEGKYKVDNKNPQVQGKTTEMYDIDGDGKKETPIRVEGYETVLEKYHTYKVWRENKGFYIGEFFEESVIPAKAKKEEIWCDAGSIDKPITSAKAGIFPNANSPPAGVGTIEHYTASYNYLAKYADVMRNAAGEKVPEALLVTVAIWKGGLENEQPTKDWITGCEKGSEGSRSDKDSFECAAGQLAGYIGNCGGLETEGKFTCVMKNYNNKDSEGRNAYTAMGGSGMTYSKLYGIFTTWNEYQPLKIEVAG